MRVEHYSDAFQFLDVARPYLIEDVPRHQLCLGIAEQVVDQPDVYHEYHAWVVSGEDGPVAVASCTPPYNYIIADALGSEALGSLASAISESGVSAPGAIGNTPSILQFLERWKLATGISAELEMGQGVFSLEKVAIPEVADGSMRRATPSDRDLVLGWWLAFLEEALPAEAPGRRAAEERVDQRLDPKRGQGLALWETKGGTTVAMSGYSAPVANFVRIGPVYTPPELRGQGYATALVATQSSHFLARGREGCLLYTDLANPTSNAIYKRIGYRQVGESMVYAFRT